MASQSSTEIDVQAATILDGLRSLEQLLATPIAREALAIAQNAETAEKYQFLSRLSKSLAQYLERKGDLFYVGFLGHFSTGKSSTINSLLQLWTTSFERDTAPNPTDTDITLITQQKNVGSVLGVIHEGHVPIRLQTVEAPLLASVVIVDTPGTGDPHLIEEIARDFLPICDLILFFLSAASPLDQTDLPLLTELHRRLPFIPVKFVVTRSDELRADRSKNISDKNIDATKRARFLAEVVRRINQLLAPNVYTEDRITLIDNVAQYKILELSDLLKEKSDPSDPQSRITMHGHKLRFYITAAKDLRIFFSDFLAGKLAELTKIVAAADKNVLRYNELGRISNDNRTRAWIDQHLAIKKIENDCIWTLQELADLPEKIGGFQHVIRQRNDAQTSLRDVAQSTARIASSRMAAVARSALVSYFGEMLGTRRPRDCLRR